MKHSIFKMQQLNTDDLAKAWNRAFKDLAPNHGVEVNGPATILQILDMIQTKNLTGMQLAELEGMRVMAVKTVEYIKLLENPKGIAWHDVKINWDKE